MYLHVGTVVATSMILTKGVEGKLVNENVVFDTVIAGDGEFVTLPINGLLSLYILNIMHRTFSSLFYHYHIHKHMLISSFSI